MKAKQSVPNTPKLPEYLNIDYNPKMKHLASILVDVGNWEFIGVVEINEWQVVAKFKRENHIAQELAILKAQVRREIEGLKNKHSSGQGWTNHLEIGYKDGITDCLSIPSLKEKE